MYNINRIQSKNTYFMNGNNVGNIKQKEHCNSMDCAKTHMYGTQTKNNSCQYFLCYVYY